MKYIIKLTVFPFVYLILMATVSIGVYALEGAGPFIKTLAAVVCFLLYFFLMGVIMYQEGGKALKVRNANDVERKRIIRTGEDRPLKLDTEYKARNGFLVGLTVCVPMILLLLIHTLLISISGLEATWGGRTAGIIYLFFFVFFSIGTPTITAFTYYYLLLLIPIMMLGCGIPYVLGAKKVELQEERIEEIHKSIHGK